MALERPFVLGLDLDGVCGDYTQIMRNLLAEKRGVELESLTLDVSWNYPEWGFSDPDEFKEFHKFAVEEKNIFASMPAMKGVSKALWELSDARVWIRIITHRLFVHWGHATAARDTVNWLDKEKIPYRELCFVGQKTEVGADVYVEDNPGNIEALRSLGKKVIVFSQPYNKDLPGPRADNWEEAKEIILQIMLEDKGSVQSNLPGIYTSELDPPIPSTP